MHVPMIFWPVLFLSLDTQVLKREEAAKKKGFQYDLSGAKELKQKQAMPDKKRGTKH